MFDSKNPQRTPISDLGEFGLIDHLVKNAKTKLSNTALAVGDDAALIDQGDHYTAISTDLLVEGVHFDLSYVPLKHLGYKAVMVNLSDIYAMNAKATQITVSIAVKFSVTFALKIIFVPGSRADSLFGIDTRLMKDGDVTSVVNVLDKLSF